MYYHCQWPVVGGHISRRSAIVGEASLSISTVMAVYW